MFPPPRTALLTGLKMALITLVPIVAAALILGGRAITPAVMGLLSVAVVPFCSGRQSAGLIAGLIVTGYVATSANGNAAAVVAVVVTVCIVAGLVSRLSAGVYGVAPIVAAVLGLAPPQNPPLTVALVMLAVSLYVLLVAHLLHIHVDPQPVPFDVAVRHGVVMAVACGTATAVALHFDWPRSYWLVMTLAIVLRPYAVDSLVKNRQRVAGTIAGAVIAAALSPLPRPWQILFAAVCMALMFAYIVERNYVLQVTFMTPMVVFLVSSGAVDDTLSMDALRLLYTVGACVAGGVLALALAPRPEDQGTAPA